MPPVSSLQPGPAFSMSAAPRVVKTYARSYYSKSSSWLIDLPDIGTEPLAEHETLDFSRADLRCADLTGADLTDAIFKRAQLKDAQVDKESANKNRFSPEQLRVMKIVKPEAPPADAEVPKENAPELAANH